MTRIDVENKPGFDKGSAYAVTVYRYGLRAPVNWGADCEDELRRMTDFWNRLVEIEHAHRAEVLALTAADEAVRIAESAASALAERIAALRAERKEARQRSRQRRPDPTLDEAIKAAQAEMKGLRTAAAVARREARGKQKPALAKLNDQRKARVKLARQQAGLYWGNYNAVCASYDRARSAAMKKGGELKFRRHCARPEDGMSTARIVNQIQGGMSASDLTSFRSSQVSLNLGTDGRRGMLRTTVHRHEGNRRVEWPIVYDRPIPDDATVQEVVITRRSVADRWDWSVSFLLRRPAALPPAPDPAACGIDLGWRRVNNGLRVATVCHGDGTHEFIVLPEIFLHRLERISELDSLRIKAADAIRALIRPLRWPDAPESLRPLAMRALRTKRPDDLHMLVVAWRQHPEWMPEQGGEASRWRSQDRKDWQEHAGLTRRITHARRDFYRCTVKRLTAQYGVIGIEAVNWALLGERENAAGQINDIAIATGRLRRLASPGAFLLELRRAAAVAGAHVHAHAGKSTWLCHNCAAAGIETVHVPADRSQLINRCPACGAVWDQDVNAAHNLRAAAIASGGDAPIPLDDAA